MQWDPATRTLSGRLRRPAGLRGYLLLAGGSEPPIEARVGNRIQQPVSAANGAWRLDIVTAAEETPWQVHYT